MIEMLVSLAATMLMMGAVVTLFGVMSESVSGSRSLLEISDRLRACRNRLQADLQGATATMKPPLRPENDEGYLEIIEGPNFDGFNGIAPTALGSTLFGDTDDVLMLTVRSRGEPFVGKFNPPTDAASTIESQTAEVIYFLGSATPPTEPILDPSASPGPLRLFNLYRRVLLIAPALVRIPPPPPPVGPPPPVFPVTDYYDRFDVSARFDNSSGIPAMIPNTLGDLTKRENRFAHYGTFPFASTVVPTPPPLRPTSNATRIPMIDPRLGDDVMMTNVLAFDVQVFDPGARIFDSGGGVALEPRDAGYAAVVGPSPLAFGAYADLGYVPGGYSSIPNTPVALFNMVNPGGVKSGSVAFGTSRVYDTWSLHYENDGIDQDGVLPADAATDGLDSDGNGLVDDANELDTQPPYSAPLRAIRVTIRVYEPSSKQVRQVTVVQDFLPE
jgi:hypothetical protein